MRWASNNCEYRLRHPRGGFTIVELLVAAAVSMLLMVILTEAFKNGIDMFRTLRAQGQMMERLRMTTTAMRNDLASYHFDPAAASGYVSQISLNHNGWVPAGSVSGADGFFRIWQAPDMLFNPQGPANPDGLPAVFEGTDGDGILLSRATTHILHFTICNRETSPVVTANNPVDPSYLFRVLEPARTIQQGPKTATWPTNYVDPPNLQENGIFGSRWAEVAYFLSPQTIGNGNLTSIVPTPGGKSIGVPLFNLYRRVKAVLPDTANWPPPSAPLYPVPASGVGFVENPKISARTDFGGGLARDYNIASDVTQPVNRMCMGATNSSANTYAAGLISPNAGPPTAVAMTSGTPPGSGYHRLVDDLTAGLNDPRAGDDLLLSDVISFEVKATWDYLDDTNSNTPMAFPPNATYNIPAISATTPNSDYPFDYLPFSLIPNNPNPPIISNTVFQPVAQGGLGVRCFDTWSSIGIYGQQVSVTPPNPLVLAYQGTSAPGNGHQSPASIPLRIRVKAVMIKIRIWDSKAQQTRQLTIIQDL